MTLVDPWSVLAGVIQLATVGFSPLSVPIVLFVHWGFRQEWWTHLHKGHSSFEAIAVWLPAVAIVMYWLNGLFLLLVDHWVRPEVLKQFKIQPGKKFDTGKIGKVCLNIVVGQVFVIIPYAFVCALLGEYTPLKIEFPEELPSGKRIALETVSFILFDEVVFYYSHWMLHSKVFGVNWYSRIHKIHHEFTAPIGLVASYCHPFEMLVSNVLPLTFGACLVRAHIYSILSWTVFAVLGTQFHHSGYRWPWVPAVDHNPDFHDFHHEKFNCNFGLLGWLDTLHGTNKLWFEHQRKVGAKPWHPLGLGISSGAALALAGTFMLQFA